MNEATATDTNEGRSQRVSEAPGSADKMVDRTLASASTCLVMAQSLVDDVAGDQIEAMLDTISRIRIAKAAEASQPSVEPEPETEGFRVLVKSEEDEEEDEEWGEPGDGD